MKLSSLIFCLACCCNTLVAQILPVNGAKLNYTQVLFEYPDYPGGVYQLEVYDITDSLHTKKIVDTTQRSNAMIITGCFDFGKKYKWKYTAKQDKTILSSPGFTYFEILYDQLIDSNYSRIIIKKKSLSPYNRGVIFLDGLKIAVDHDGKPLWYMNFGDKNFTFRDINLTNSGSVTFIYGNRAIETTLDGKIAWEAPDDEKNIFHHDFNKLKNGNYIVCGLREIQLESAAEISGPSLADQSDNSIYSASVMEFDKHKKTIWHFDLIPELKKTGVTFERKELMRRLGHLNGLAVDEKNNIVYASFKNFSSIFKIDKSTNNILHVFGSSRFNLADSLQGGKYFASQHCPALLSNGNVMVFNNNVKHKSSSIVEIKNPAVSSFDDEKVWEYRFDENDPKVPQTTHMGSVQELPWGHFLICAGGINDRIFEVTRNHVEVWDMFTERNSVFMRSDVPEWGPASNYRAFYASSLYPYYFTLQSSYNNAVIPYADLSKGAKMILNNIGSEQDTYNITVENAAGKKLGRTEHVMVKAGQRIVQTIPLITKETIRKGEQLSVHVTSANNSSTKVLKYKVQ